MNKSDCDFMLDLMSREFNGASFVERDLTPETISHLRWSVMEFLRVQAAAGRTNGVSIQQLERDLMITVRLVGDRRDAALTFMNHDACQPIKMTLRPSDSWADPTRLVLVMALDTTNPALKPTSTIRTNIRTAFFHAIEAWALAGRRGRPDLTRLPMLALVDQCFAPSASPTETWAPRFVYLPLLRYLRGYGIMECSCFWNNEVFDSDVWPLDQALAPAAIPETDPQTVINSFIFLQGTP